MRKNKTDIYDMGNTPKSMSKMGNIPDFASEEQVLPTKTEETEHPTKPLGCGFPKTQLNWKPTPLEEWWDSQDVRTRFHFSERTLCTMREKKLLPYAIVGGRCFYRAQDLKKLFDDSFRRLNPELAASEANKMQSTHESEKAYNNAFEK